MEWSGRLPGYQHKLQHRQWHPSWMTKRYQLQSNGANYHHLCAESDSTQHAHLLWVWKTVWHSSSSGDRVECIKMVSMSILTWAFLSCTVTVLNWTERNLSPGLQRFTQKKKAADLPAGRAPRNSLGWATSHTTPPPHTVGCTQWAEDIWCLQKSFFSNSHLQKFKTRHGFQAYLCYDVWLLNFMFLLHHPIWVKGKYKERKRTF